MQSSSSSPSEGRGNALSTVAIVLGSIAFLFLPIAFGPASIILAVVARTKKERRANIALTVGILGMVVGMIIGAVIGLMKATA